MKEGTAFFTIRAMLPVVESFGFADGESSWEDTHAHFRLRHITSCPIIAPLLHVRFDSTSAGPSACVDPVILTQWSQRSASALQAPHPPNSSSRALRPSTSIRSGYPQQARSLRIWRKKRIGRRLCGWGEEEEGDVCGEEYCGEWGEAEEAEAVRERAGGGEDLRTCDITASSHMHSLHLISDA
jgi:hypothetical protein